MLRLNTRWLLKSALGHTLWPTLTRFTSNRSIGGAAGLIYSFHYVGKPVIPGVAECLFVTREVLAGTLDFICEHLHPLSPLEFFERLESASLPRGATMITYDDCTQDAYRQALPEMKKRGLTGCFFACPGLIESGRSVPCLELMNICAQASEGEHKLCFEVRNAAGAEMAELQVEISDTASRAAAYYQIFPFVYRTATPCHPRVLASICGQMGATVAEQQYRLANWDELGELYREGNWIANHTMRHSTPYADSLPELERDICAAYQILDARFPAPRRIFCYPYGSAQDVTPETRQALERMSTHAAFVTRGGLARPSRDGMLDLHREDAAYSVGGAKLAPLLALAR